MKDRAHRNHKIVEYLCVPILQRKPVGKQFAGVGTLQSAESPCNVSNGLIGNIGKWGKIKEINHRFT